MTSVASRIICPQCSNGLKLQLFLLKDKPGTKERFQCTNVDPETSYVHPGLGVNRRWICPNCLGKIIVAWRICDVDPDDEPKFQAPPPPPGAMAPHFHLHGTQTYDPKDDEDEVEEPAAPMIESPKKKTSLPDVLSQVAEEAARNPYPATLTSTDDNHSFVFDRSSRASRRVTADLDDDLPPAVRDIVNDIASESGTERPSPVVLSQLTGLARMMVQQVKRPPAVDESFETSFETSASMPDLLTGRGESYDSDDDDDDDAAPPARVPPASAPYIVVGPVDDNSSPYVATQHLSQYDANEPDTDDDADTLDDVPSLEEIDDALYTQEEEKKPAKHVDWKETSLTVLTQYSQPETGVDSSQQGSASQEAAALRTGYTQPEFSQTYHQYAEWPGTGDDQQEKKQDKPPHDDQWPLTQVARLNRYGGRV